MFRHLFRKRDRATREPGPTSDLMIVRRGLSPSFYFFCQVFAKEHNLVVVPDRRAHDRRRRERATPTIDRRAQDRRGEPPRWRSEDFIVLRDPRRADYADES